MATRVDAARDTAQNAQKGYFRMTDQVPEEVWYWAALGSILASASLFLLASAIGAFSWGSGLRPSFSLACFTSF